MKVSNPYNIIKISLRVVNNLKEDFGVTQLVDDK